MRILYLVMLTFIFSLSLTAGAAKIMEFPQEIAFFQRAGIGAPALFLMGAAQILSAACLIFKKSRALGAVIAAICFAISAIVILAVGQIVFALVSLIPVAIAIFVFRQERQA